MRASERFGRTDNRGSSATTITTGAVEAGGGIENRPRRMTSTRGGGAPRL